MDLKYYFGGYNPKDDPLAIAVGGSLSVPDLDGAVNITSPGSSIPNLFNKTKEEIKGILLEILQNIIKRDDAGLWTSGKMTIAAEDNSVGVEFSDAGSAELTDTLNPDNPWTVDDWQNELDPIAD